ncbi:Uncharacterized protein dnm_045320 [Desulfonema magnum]|uniref:Uncharacterized protein n=1 Tax=Desulfonema magnum TaxID=45655 RepID=A0A975GP72_9BACT|nr:Uncharacterized protein dnm_045320 [Desulfonema magnum]
MKISPVKNFRDTEFIKFQKIIFNEFQKAEECNLLKIGGKKFIEYIRFYA